MATIEFFGIPRQRAGVPSTLVDADTVGAALSVLREKLPGLADLMAEDGKLSSHYLLSLDGVAFVRDLDTELAPAARLLLLSADAGG